MSTTTTDPTPVTFTYNIAFTAPVNTPTSAPHLSSSELWTGIKRGGRNPHDFAEYVSDCTVLSGDAHNFRRRLVLADGAVHTASGAMLDQDVHIANKLHVEAATVGTGAKSTFLLSYDAQDEKTDADLYLTAMYELRLSDVLPGTEKAKGIEVDYRKLAQKACRSAVEDIRRWKTEGKLELWAKEDEN